MTQVRELNVLVVDEEIPYPLTSGKRIRTYHLLKNLAERHRITFLCHRNMDAAEQHEAEAEFQRLGIRVELLDRSLPNQTLLTAKSKLFWELTRNLFSPLPYLVQKHLSKELRERIVQLSRRDDVDLVHFEWSPYAGAIRADFRTPWAADAHNVESLIWKRYVQAETNPLKRAFIKYQWRKFDRFERRIFQQASRMVFVSRPDCRIARDDFGCQRGTVVENGVDTAGFPFRGMEGRDANRLLFLGSLDWRPNVDGLYFFLDQVWPSLLAANPELHLDVVGRKPAAETVERLAAVPAATFYADAPSVAPHLARAGMLVVPLRVGGGSRLKILEAAASGLPVMSTTIGSEGLDLKPGTHFLVADSAEAFVQQIGQRHCEQETLGELARNARREVEQRFEWRNIATSLEQVWQDLAKSPADGSKQEIEA